MLFFLEQRVLQDVSHFYFYKPVDVLGLKFSRLYFVERVSFPLVVEEGPSRVTCSKCLCFGQEAERVDLLTWVLSLGLVMWVLACVTGLKAPSSSIVAGLLSFS